ncbi:hypothetical protein [Methylomonas koyamae]|nr:hypothetical protein [Methylomonas koyamae]
MLRLKQRAIFGGFYNADFPKACNVTEINCSKFMPSTGAWCIG